ncbi:MAG: hypothetical protein P1P88_06810 [Bacteroidales bacterium]|nr:hypothetical protein [Bacteroidales bacterium]
MEIVDAYNLKVLWSYGGIVFNFVILIVCFSFLFFKRSAEIALICIGSAFHFISSMITLYGYLALSGRISPVYFDENEIYFVSNALSAIGTTFLFVGIVVLFVIYVRTTRKMELGNNA